MKKVIHSKFGQGIIIEDHHEPLRDNEVFVEYDNGLPYLRQSAIAGYEGNHLSEDTMYEKRDIANISDLTNVDGTPVEIKKVELTSEEKDMSEVIQQVLCKEFEAALVLMNQKGIPFSKLMKEVFHQGMASYILEMIDIAEKKWYISYNSANLR